LRSPYSAIVYENFLIGTSEGGAGMASSLNAENRPVLLDPFYLRTVNKSHRFRLLVDHELLHRGNLQWWRRAGASLPEDASGWGLPREAVRW
jgi:predicted metalloprotease with PDZ domain